MFQLQRAQMVIPEVANLKFTLIDQTRTFTMKALIYFYSLNIVDFF
jgi:hypothetical protein